LLLFCFVTGLGPSSVVNKHAVPLSRFTRVWNLVSHIKESTQTEHVWRTGWWGR